jgi:hypothetical protein
MAVHALFVRAEEDRPVEAFTDGQIDGAGGPGCERDGDDLPALAQDGQSAVAAFDAQRVDVGTEGFGDP